MKLAIVTDSTAFLPEEIKNHPDLYIIPIPVILDGKLYNEGINSIEIALLILQRNLKMLLMLYIRKWQKI